MRILVLILKKSCRYFLVAAITAVIVVCGIELYLNTAAFWSDRAYLATLGQRLSGASDIRVLIVSEDPVGPAQALLVRDALASRFKDKNVHVSDVFLPSQLSSDGCADFLKSQFDIYAPDIVVLYRGIYDSLPSAQESVLRFVFERFRLGRRFVSAFGSRLLPLIKFRQVETVLNKPVIEDIRKQLRLELGIKSESDFKYVKHQPRSLGNQENAWMAISPPDSLFSGCRSVDDRIKVLLGFIKQNPDAFDSCLDLALLYFEQQRYQDLIEMIKDLSVRAPGFVAGSACAELVWTTMNLLGLHEENIEFQNRIVLSCTDVGKTLQIYNRIGFSMVECRSFDEVERFYKELVLRFTDNPDSFLHLGQIYINTKHFALAQKWAGQVFESFKAMPGAYYDYACMLLFDSFLSTGEMTFRDEKWFWRTVRTHQVERGKYFSGMAVHLLGQGHEQQARKWFRRAHKESRRRFNLSAVSKYRKMAQLCLENNLGLCFMQYPLRKTDSLRKMVADTAGRIVFVENFDAFYDVVRTQGFDYCFIDRVGADCGALTQEAVPMIARNLAKQIIGLIEKD